MAALLYMISMLPHVFKKDLFVGLSKYLVPICLLIFTIFISSIIHINAYSTKLYDTTFLLNIFMFVVLCNHAKMDYRVFVDGFWSMALTAAVISVLALLGIGVSLSDINESGRFTIFGDNANSVAIKSAVSILIILWFSLKNGKMEKPIRLVLIVPLLMLLLKTGSRGGFLALIAGLIVMVIGFPAANFKSRIRFLIVAVLAFAGLYTLIKGEGGLLIDRLTESVKEGNSSGRDVIWDYYKGVIKSSPVIGVGYCGMEEASLLYFGIPNRSPHNVFIEIGVFSGFVGLFFYLLFLLRVFIKAIKLFRIKDLLPLMLLMPLLSDNMFGQALNVKLTWIIISYVVTESYMVSVKGKTVNYG